MAHKNLNVPNTLTVLRMLLVPVIVAKLNPVNLRTPTLYEVDSAAILFTIAFLTDWMDGYYARKYNLVTPLGEFLDPLADKIIILCPLVALVPHGWAPGWVVSLMMFREFGVTGLRAIASEQGLRVNSTTSGRTKTVYQFTAVFLLICHYPMNQVFGRIWPESVPGPSMHAMGLVFLYISLAFSLYSGIKYFIGFIRADREQAG